MEIDANFDLALVRAIFRGALAIHFPDNVRKAYIQIREDQRANKMRGSRERKIGKRAAGWQGGGPPE